MKIPSWVLCVLVLAGCPGPDAPSDAATADGPGAAGDTPTTDVNAADAAAMEALVRSYADEAKFMGAVLVSRGGVVLLDRAYGYANLEWSVPNTLASKFRIGSMSKQFTAAAILRLEEQGKLHTDDLLAKHLTDAPPTWAGITLHHLLSHTSGIPDLVFFPDYPMLRTQPSPPEKTYQLLRTKPLDFAPGQKFQYSNSGYVVLALLIERLTGTPYNDFLRDRILAPAGMLATGGDAPRPLLKNRADGYVPLTPPGADPALPPPLPVAYRNADFIDMSFPTGGGGLYSTTGDLRLWVRALFGGQVLTPASFTKMTTVNQGNYGYGLFIAQPGGVRRIGHGGSVHGFLSSMTYFPDTDILIVVLSNTTAGLWLSEMIAQLESLATHQPKPAPLPAPSDAGRD